MRNLRLTAYELRRLIRQPLTWGVLGLMLAICASTITGALDLFLQGRRATIFEYYYTATDRYLLEPLANSLIPCGLGIGLLLMLELDRIKQNNMRTIIHSITDPGGQYARVLTSIAILAVLSAASVTVR